MTTTPTSGAADLRTAAQAVVDRWDTPLWKDVPATAEYIGRLRAALAAGQVVAPHPACKPDTLLNGGALKLALNTLRRAGKNEIADELEATAQPAAQQGAAYAALPDEGEPWRGHKFKEVQRGCWRCDCGKTIKEVTSDQSTPASGGNYPVMPKRYTVDDDGEELFTAEKMRAFADATHTLRASHGQAPAGAGEPTEQQILEAAFAPAQPAVEASRFGSPELQAMIIARCVEKDQADSVQEDAARYRWLRDQAHPDSEDSGIAVSESDFNDWGKKFTRYYSGEELDAAIDAARATDSVQEDAAREAIEKVLALFPFNAPIQKFSVNNGPCLTADNDDEFYSVKRVLAFLTEIKTTLDAARKQGANHDR